VALEIARHLGFEMSLMAELLPIGIQGMKVALSEKND